ncbi:MAG: DUF262 domain-containing protein, partial [Gammaproteobacteria bacterium]|nr:DUF262 domain-containing protein [Gammaproteobacteria bacterium]
MTEQTHTAEEGIEGIDGDEDSSLGEYPIDTVLIRTETRTVHDVLRRIDSDQFILNPDFQRDFIWTDAKQSKLIESVLMRIPLPVFYLAENEEGNMIVVDGLQRISTFQRYVNNSHPLRLPHQKELNKKKFSQLSPKLQNRIEDCNLILYVIDAKVPEQARLDIFERVNSGVPLTRQQMRNSIYMGEATRFLRAESITDIFTKATGSSLNPRTMRDREFINRFCSFKLLPINDYKGDMDDWLATSLETMNKFSKNELNLLSKKFQLSLKNNFELFKDHAFRKHIPDQTHRSLVNASLWDVMSV